MYKEDGFLIFCEENQHVGKWGFMEDSNQDDPPVYQGWLDGSKKRWEIDKQSISEFLIAMAYWQAVNGGLSYNHYYSGVIPSKTSLGGSACVLHINNDFVVHIHCNTIILIFGKYGKKGEMYFGANLKRYIDESKRCFLR